MDGEKEWEPRIQKAACSHSCGPRQPSGMSLADSSSYLWRCRTHVLASAVSAHYCQWTPRRSRCWKTLDRRGTSSGEGHPPPQSDSPLPRTCHMDTGKSRGAMLWHHCGHQHTFHICPPFGRESGHCWPSTCTALAQLCLGSWCSSQGGHLRSSCIQSCQGRPGTLLVDNSSIGTFRTPLTRAKGERKFNVSCVSTGVISLKGEGGQKKFKP